MRGADAWGREVGGGRGDVHLVAAEFAFVVGENVTFAGFAEHEAETTGIAGSRGCNRGST